MHTDVTIHMASEADLDALVRLAVAFRDHVGQLTPSAEEFCSSIALLLREANTEFFLAGTPTGGAVGYVQCRYRYSAWRLALEAELEDVFVVCEARRRGVGQRLVAFAIARATAKGCRSLGLSTNERNTEALSLYQHLGFVAESARWQGGRYLWLQRTLDPPELEAQGSSAVLGLPSGEGPTDRAGRQAR
jgi:ribosomal protein S18 acetylase RimI-like enzyme